MDYTFLLGIALVSAVLNWVAVERHWKALEYVVKPATMVILILWLVLNGGLSGAALWFTLGAVFCLAGDVFLMVPRNLFIFGLLSFLIGHVFYIVGFNAQPVDFSGGGWLYLLIFAAILGLVISQIYTRLAKGLQAKKLSQLKLPVLIYATVITLMVLSALMCFYRPGWETTPALWAVAGALLFYLSDTILSMDRFVNPLPHARLLTMTTYHLGQLGILVSAAMTFLM